MKKLFLLFLILVAFTLQAQQAHWLVPQPFGADIYDMDYYDNSRVLAVGNMGSMAISHDGAQSWTQLPALTGQTLKEIYWLNENEIIVRADGILLYSADGGFTWSVRYQTSEYIMKQMEFVSPSVGYALFERKVDSLTYLAKTIDGGQSWNIFPEPGPWLDLTFKNADTGILLSNEWNYKIYRTTDGGNTIQVVWDNYQYLARLPYACAWAAGDTVFAVGKYYWKALVMRSTDNGVTWEDVYNNLPFDRKLDHLKIKNKRNIYAWGNYEIVKSHDMGATWTRVQVENTLIISGKESFIALAADKENLKSVYYFDPDMENQSTRYLLAYNAAQNSISRDFDQTMYTHIYALDINSQKVLTGLHNHLYVSNNTGLTWSNSLYYDSPYLYHLAFFTELKWANAQQALACARLYKVSNLGPDEVFTSVFYTPDGGQTWNLQQDASLPACISLAFPTSDRAYFLGRRCLTITKKDFFPNQELSYYGPPRFFRSSDQGLHWTELPLPADTLANMDFLSREEGFIFGGGGTTPSTGFYHTLDGGDTWTYVPLGLPPIVKGQLVDAHLMYFLTADSIPSIYRALYNGTNWDTLKVFTCLPGQWIRDIGFTGENTGYVLCLSHQNSQTSFIYYTTDAGNTWQLLGTYPYLNSLRVTYNLNGFAYGLMGRILQLNEGYPTGISFPQVPTSMNEPTLRPNSFGERFRIILPKSQSGLRSDVSIFDLGGRLLYQTTFQGTQAEIYPGPLASGVYLVSIQNEQGRWVIKGVKE
ncbi:MAG: T9SS type A sorting domain-containing protein [Bacteroidales bacterium]